jgi:hypothetical protein
MPWRAMKAIGVGLPLVGEGCWRMETAEDGLPHGVSRSTEATLVKCGRFSIPVPPMTAMRTGSGPMSALLGLREVLELQCCQRDPTSPCKHLKLDFWDLLAHIALGSRENS